MLLTSVGKHYSMILNKKKVVIGPVVGSRKKLTAARRREEQWEEKFLTIEIIRNITLHSTAL